MVVVDRFELLRAMTVRQQKDVAGSVTRREEGNRAFQAGDLSTALAHYSRAALLALPDTQDLAAAFANRCRLA